MNNLFKQIKELKKIEPSLEWQTKQRLVLLNIIADCKKPIETKETKQVFGFFLFRQTLLSMIKPSLIVFLVLAVIAGSGATVDAAQTSLPGDILYSVKIAAEKAQITLTLGEEKKLAMGLEIAAKRIKEVKQIAENPESIKEKEKKVKVSVEKFKEEIEGVKTRLSGLRAESPKAVEAVSAAKAIDNKTEEFQKILKETPKKLSSTEMKDKIEEALDKADEASLKAVEVIVEKGLEKEVNMSQPEIKERVEKQISKVEKKVEEMKQENKAMGETKEEKAENKNLKIEKAATKVLEEAKTLLEKNDFQEALSKVKESQKITQSAEKEIKKASVESAEKAPSPTIIQEQKTTPVNGPVNVNNSNTINSLNINSSLPQGAEVQIQADLDQILEEKFIRKLVP